MTAPSYSPAEGLDVFLDDRALHLVLARPEKRNAISEPMMYGLLDALDTAGTDERVRVIVLRGAGEHFCGGADIIARNADRDARPRTGSIQRRLPTQAHRLVAMMLHLQTPIVCGVRGWAAGIGFQLALAADFTIAAADARFWAPFVSRGFTPDSGATWLLPRRVGDVRAREMLLLGRELTGAEAAEWGAIHRAVPAADLDRELGDLATRLAGGPTVALGLTKWLLHSGRSASLEQQLADEAFALELSSRTEDFREGMTAFADRRPPEFRGR
jgi:2-(1,2-epoxy-1,2-dihydrophenyl)acetyl-CoA isomerase